MFWVFFFYLEQVNQTTLMKATSIILTSQMDYPLRGFRTELCELLNQAVLSLEVASSSLIFFSLFFFRLLRRNRLKQHREVETLASAV